MSLEHYTKIPDERRIALKKQYSRTVNDAIAEDTTDMAWPALDTNHQEHAGGVVIHGAKRAIDVNHQLPADTKHEQAH